MGGAVIDWRREGWPKAKLLPGRTRRVVRTPAAGVNWV